MHYLNGLAFSDRYRAVEPLGTDLYIFDRDQQLEDHHCQQKLARRDIYTLGYGFVSSFGPHSLPPLSQTPGCHLARQYGWRLIR